MSEPVEFLQAKTLYRTAVVKVELLESTIGKPIRVKDSFMVTVYVYSAHEEYAVKVSFEGSDPNYVYNVYTPRAWCPTEINCANVAQKFVEDWMKKEDEE